MADLVLPLTYLSSFAFAFLLVLGLFYRPEAWAVVRRLDELSAAGEAAIEQATPGRYEQSWWQRVGLPAFRWLGRGTVRFTPVGLRSRTQARLEAAGAPGRLGPLEFQGIRALSIGVSVLLALLLARYLPVGPVRMAGVLLAVLCGVLVPDSVLNNAVYKRQTKVRRSMPDILDLLVVSVQAGLGLDGAMGKVVDKVKGPLPEEFGRVLEEVRLGKPRGAALKDMARRVGIPELSSFVAALYQAEVLGVSVAHVLTVQAETVRERRSHLAREAAGRLPVKMLFPLVFFIFPALFVVIIGPGVIQMREVLFKVLGAR